ncbi:MAG: hypothetical protein PHE25_05285 [Candidatus Gracilibacteria bacterium]|nr:hypothetical protein [Candidatus Gracilibacteria bacterium]
MQDIKIWEEKIKEKRKKTEFRKFLKEIASWKPFGFYKTDGILSRYPQTDRIGKIVPASKYNRDSLKSLNYDFDITFFENFRKLIHTVDLRALVDYSGNENSEFADCIFGGKNVYLSTVVGINSENILYSAFSYVSIKNVFNSVLVTDNSENIYWSTMITNSFNIFYSKNISNSSNIWFSTNLIGCSNCIGCNLLENKSYCIGNKEYSKENFEKYKKEILKEKNDFLKNYKLSNHDFTNYGSVNVKGKGLFFCDNVENGYFFKRLKNGRNVLIGTGGSGVENYYDCIDVGSEAYDFYGVTSAGNGNNLYMSSEVGWDSYIYYSLDLESCSFCLGCIGLKNKSFCILNKQYSKEEWYELANKIFSQMEADGILGDFFPGELNPFYFNDTMAYLIDDSFTKDEVISDGYMWRDEKIKVDIPENAEIVETKNLSSFQGFDSNGNWQINPEIMKKVIQDENGNIYKIVPMEYEFLMKHGLPLPEIHWLDRIKLGFKFK